MGLRPFDIVMILCVFAGAAYTYKIKRDSELAMKRVGKLERQIKAEKDRINVLKADWNLLTSPERIQLLVDRYGKQLRLEQTVPEKFGTISDLPERANAADEYQRSVDLRNGRIMSDKAGIGGLIDTSQADLSGSAELDNNLKVEEKNYLHSPSLGWSAQP